MIKINGTIDGRVINLTIQHDLTPNEGREAAQFVRGFYQELFTSTAHDLPAIMNWYVNTTGKIVDHVEHNKAKIKAAFKTMGKQIEKLAVYFTK